MPISPLEFFASGRIDEKEQHLLDLDVAELIKIIDNNLSLDQSKNIGTLRFSDTFIEMAFSISSSEMNTPTLPRYIHYLRNTVRAIYYRAGWEDLTLQITSSGRAVMWSDGTASATDPTYSFVIKLNHK